ncbi:MAG: LiaF transmembrane domain-containing protein [bacterium]
MRSWGYERSVEPKRRSAPLAAALAALAIAAGVLLLLDRNGFLDAWSILRYWPIPLILLGILSLTRTGPRIPGVVLAGAGLLGAGEWFGASLWPLAIIAAGVALMWAALGGLRAGSGRDPVRLSASAVLMPVERRLSTPEFEGGEALAMWGALDVNLRQADIRGGEAVIRAHALFADITFHVPEDWIVHVEGIPLLGRYSDSTRHPPSGRAEPPKRLVVTGFALFGGVDVRN